MTQNDQHGYEDLDFEGVVASSSDEFDVHLGIQPEEISVPSEVEFTITNNMEFPYEFSPDKYPVVFSEGEDGWEKFPVAERLVIREDVLVDDTYSFKREIPYSNWEPGSGRYLLLIYGRVLEEGASHKVNIVDTIEIV
jgi:hypothetical protein